MTGPDFKQTGDRLKSVIHTLFEHTCRLIAPVEASPPTGQGKGVNDGSTCEATSTSTTTAATATSTNSSNTYNSDSSSNTGSGDGHGMTLVYDKEWSSAKLSGGMSFA